MAYIVGGGVGGLFGFYLPLFVLLSRERGHEMEVEIASSPIFGNFDTLLLLMVLSGCCCAGVGCWLLPKWIYPRHRD